MPRRGRPARPHRRCSRGPPARSSRCRSGRAGIAGSGAGKGRERPPVRRCAPRPLPLPRALTVSDGDGHGRSGRRHLAPPQEPSAAQPGRARSASLPQQEHGNAAFPGVLTAAPPRAPDCGRDAAEAGPAGTGPFPPHLKRGAASGQPWPVTLITCPPSRSSDRINRQKRHTKRSANLRDFMSSWNT